MRSAIAETVTFLCKRAILVHFFSSNVSYFFMVAESKTSSESFSSSLRAAAAFGNSFADRYATIDLCLVNQVSFITSGVMGIAYTHSSSACRLAKIGLIVGSGISLALKTWALIPKPCVPIVVPEELCYVIAVFGGVKMQEVARSKTATRSSTLAGY